MEILHQALAVLTVLATLGLTLWWLRRKGLAQFAAPGARGKTGRRLQHIERLALSAQHSLHLVRVADRTILVGISPSGCTVLDSQIPAQAETFRAEGSR